MSIHVLLAASPQGQASWYAGHTEPNPERERDPAGLQQHHDHDPAAQQHSSSELTNEMISPVCAMHTDSHRQQLLVYLHYNVGLFRGVESGVQRKALLERVRIPTNVRHVSL
ncbi:hypothetical protein VTI28DRAFT_2555 [Corynascus sepedonium]